MSREHRGAGRLGGGMRVSTRGILDYQTRFYPQERGNHLRLVRQGSDKEKGDA